MARSASPVVKTKAKTLQISEFIRMVNALNANTKTPETALPPINELTGQILDEANVWAGFTQVGKSKVRVQFTEHPYLREMEKVEVSERPRFAELAAAPAEEEIE